MISHFKLGYQPILKFERATPERESSKLRESFAQFAIHITSIFQSDRQSHQPITDSASGSGGCGHKFV